MDKNKTLNFVKEALDKALAQKKLTEDMLSSLGPAVVETLRPILQELSANSKITKEEIIEALSNIKIDVPKADVPQAQVEVKIPEIKVPAPQVTVNVPEIKLPEFPEIKLPVIKVPKPEVTVNFDASKIRIPDIVMPDEMDIKGWVGVMGYDKGLLSNPLPVQLRDAQGRPVDLSGGITNIGGGAISSRMVKVINDANNPIPISGTISATFSADFGAGATGAETLRTVAATDSVQSVNIVSGSSSGTQYADGDARGTATGNLLMLDDGTNIQSARGGAGVADARTLRVVQATDAVVSVNIVSGSSSGAIGQGDAASATRVVIAGNSDASVTATQTGTWNIGTVTTVTGVTNTVITRLDSPDGPYSGSNPLPIYITGAAASTYAEIMNPDGRVKVELPTGSSGLTDTELRASSIPVAQVSGANWSTSVTNTVTVTGSLTSTVVVGPTVADAADDGNAPIQIGGIARTANPTAVAANDVVKATFDTVGRQLIRDVQVRGLLATAYATLTNGTETTLLAGAASTFHDLIYILGANTSSNSILVEIRDGTGSGVVLPLMIPAGGTAGVVPKAPIPSNAAANTWTADMGDDSTTTVYVSALFSKEV